MLHSKGRVVGAAQGVMRVRVDTPCGSCAHSCLGSAVRVPRELRVRHEGLAVGTPVQLALARSSFTRACVWVFGLPLLGLLVGAVIGEHLREGVEAQLGAVAGALLASAAVLGRRRALAGWIQLDLVADSASSVEN